PAQHLPDVGVGRRIELPGRTRALGGASAHFLASRLDLLLRDVADRDDLRLRHEHQVDHMPPGVAACPDETNTYAHLATPPAFESCEIGPSLGENFELPRVPP